MAAIGLCLVRLEVDRGTEKPPHLLLQTLGVAPGTATRRIEAELADETGEGVAHFQAPPPCPDRLGIQPEQQQAWQAAVWIPDGLLRRRVETSPRNHKCHVTVGA